MTPDSSGRIPIRIPHPDPNGWRTSKMMCSSSSPWRSAVAHSPACRSRTRHVRWPAQLVGRDTDLAAVGGPVATPDWGGAVFSDDARAASSYTISTRAWGRYSSTGNRNEVTATLLDQYGDAHSGTAQTSYRFTLTPSGGTVATANVASNGRARVVYTNPPTEAARTETAEDSPITVQSVTKDDAGEDVVVDVTIAAETPTTVYWAEPGSAGDSENVIVRVADPAARSVVVGADTDPLYYTFGSDDSFLVGETAVSFAQFMEVLNAANNPKITDITINRDDGSETMLAWTGYNAAQPRDRSTWTLTGSL